MRRRIVAGNWKMNLNAQEAASLARAVVQAIQALRAGDWSVKPLQEYHGVS